MPTKIISFTDNDGDVIVEEKIYEFELKLIDKGVLNYNKTYLISNGIMRCFIDYLGEKIEEEPIDYSYFTESNVKKKD